MDWSSVSTETEGSWQVPHDYLNGTAAPVVSPWYNRMMLDSIDPLYSLSGFFVGLLVGQTGMGGGALMTPLLILLFGVHPATAVGTDLLYASATKTVGTLVHGLNTLCTGALSRYSG